MRAQKDFDEFVSIIRQEFGYREGRNLYGVCRQLRRNATAYHTIQERWCNEEMGDRMRQKVERRETNIEKRVRELCADLDAKCEPVFQGDPRGAVIKLRMPSGNTNDWGREGVCVPTSR